MSLMLKSTAGWVIWGAKFGEEGVDRCKTNFHTIWERLSYAEEIVLISSAIWAQCTNVTDIQTDHGTVTSITVGEITCQRCRLKIKAPNVKGMFTTVIHKAYSH